MNIDYINKVAPTHDKTSCSDESQSNARHAPDDFGGCYRCTLITAAKTSEPNERDRLYAANYRWLREIGAPRGVLDWTELGVPYQDVEAMDAAIAAARAAQDKA